MFPFLSTAIGLIKSLERFSMTTMTSVSEAGWLKNMTSKAYPDCFVALSRSKSRRTLPRVQNWSS